MIVGPEGVSWQNAEGRSLTVRFDDCVGVLAGSNGVRVLWGRDGFSVRVVPADWRGGPDAVARIDAAIPANLVLPLDPPD